jgi:hypothetical protein
VLSQISAIVPLVRSFGEDLQKGEGHASINQCVARAKMRGRRRFACV